MPSPGARSLRATRSTTEQTGRPRLVDRTAGLGFVDRPAGVDESRREDRGRDHAEGLRGGELGSEQAECNAKGALRD